MEGTLRETRHAASFGKRCSLSNTSPAGVTPGTVLKVRDKVGTETDTILVLRELTF